MGWYDLNMVREGQDFKVDIKYKTTGDLTGYFLELKVFRWTQKKVQE